MKVTLKTIADLAGTSPATVSRALTNRGYVSDRIRVRIEKAVEETGYTPKMTQQIAIDQVKKIVMVISANITSQVYINYFQGITDYLSKKGYICLEAFSDANPAKEAQYLRFASNNQFGAVVLLNISETPDLSRQLTSVRCPVVFVNRYLRSADVDAICVDNYRGGYTATKYLIDAGHKNIIHLAGLPSSVVSQDRLLGFQDALLDAGLPFSSKNIFQGDLTKESGEELGRFLSTAEHDFTAVFVSNDMMAIGLLNSLFAHGVLVPDDISIISFDTTPIVKNARVKLTTVGFSSFEMGVAAGEIVYQRMHAKKGTPRRVIYPATIEEGDSVRILHQT